jgi:hypothetical protein
LRLQGKTGKENHNGKEGFHTQPIGKAIKENWVLIIFSLRFMELYLNSSSKPRRCPRPSKFAG